MPLKLRLLIVGGLLTFTVSLSAMVINGSKELALLYPSAVILSFPHGLCSGVKVSEKLFLTAAHCIHTNEEVSDNKLRIKVQHPLNLEAGPISYNLKIKESFLPAVYKQLCSTPKKCKETRSMLRVAFDFALILVDEDTPAIDIATISFSPIAVPNLFTFVGGGLDFTTIDESDRIKLTFEKKTSILRGMEISPVESKLSLATKFVLKVSGKLLPRGGRGHSKTLIGTSIAPGDSGGPLYLAQTNQIIGLASSGVSLHSIEDENQPIETDSSFVLLAEREDWFSMRLGRQDNDSDNSQRLIDASFEIPNLRCNDNPILRFNYIWISSIRKGQAKIEFGYQSMGKLYQRRFFVDQELLPIYLIDNLEKNSSLNESDARSFIQLINSLETEDEFKCKILSDEEAQPRKFDRNKLFERVKAILGEDL